MLWIEGEGEHLRLGYEVPPGVLRLPILAAVKASKRELLALLQAKTTLVAPVEVEAQAQVLEPSKPAMWSAEIGCWQRCGGIVPTVATAENARRYRESKRALAQVLVPSPRDYNGGEVLEMRYICRFEVKPGRKAHTVKVGDEVGDLARFGSESVTTYHHLPSTGVAPVSEDDGSTVWALGWPVSTWLLISCMMEAWETS